MNEQDYLRLRVAVKDWAGAVRERVQGGEQEDEGDVCDKGDECREVQAHAKTQ